MKKTKILFIPSTQSGGVWYYRVYTPMLDLSKRHGDEFDITINGTYKFTDAEKDEIGKNYQVVWIHNCLFTSDYQEEAWRTIVYCKKVYGTRFVLDIDDFWVYHKNHPAVDACLFNAFPQKMMVNFKLFDYVTTTTEYFKGVISEFFPAERIYVFENAISNDDVQFSGYKTPSDKLRIGLTGGSSHTEDIKQLLEFPRYLTEKQLDEIELVFCGYDTKAENVTVDENGKIVDRKPLDDKLNWWVQTENKFKSQVKHYKRIKSKNICDGKFGKIYEDIDVLLVPLENNKFNRCKSELKFIEAGFTNTAVVCSNVVPYNNFGIDNNTCLIVKEPNPQAWAKDIKKLLRDKPLLYSITSNNTFNVKTLRNLERITEKRVEFLRKITSGVKIENEGQNEPLDALSFKS